MVNFRPFRLVTATLLLSTLAALPALATGGPTDGPTRAVVLPSSRDANTVAYVMAWRNAHSVTEHADALRLAATLATRIGLPAGPAYEALEKYFDTELAANPGRFLPTEDPQQVVEQLLREDISGFQRIISPLAPAACYIRYQELLDSLNIKA